MVVFLCFLSPISLSYGRFPPSNSTSMSQAAANRLLLCCKWTLSFKIVVLLVLFRLLHLLYSKLEKYHLSCYLKHLKVLTIDGQQQQQHSRCNLTKWGLGRVGFYQHGRNNKYLNYDHPRNFKKDT